MGGLPNDGPQEKTAHGGALRFSTYEPGQKLIQWINFPAIEQHDAASEEKTMARRPRRNHSPAFKV